MKKISPKLQNEQNANYAGIEELWASEKFLQNYNSSIVAKLAKFSNKTSEVLEFGAGLGTLANIWHSKKIAKPECLEIDPTLRGILISRGFICYESIDDTNKLYDMIYCSNVLEHIEDDLGALKKMYSKLKVNGYLALYVPAFMCLYNDLDSLIGHYRRYGKKELSEKLASAGFKIIESHYSDSIGFFAWLIFKVKVDGNNNLSDGNSLRFYDKYIFPLSNLLDNFGFRYFFGKNIMIIGRKI
jgi:hypothetical protein